jgi:hypothetical protein
MTNDRIKTETLPILPTERVEMSGREWGRKAILAGWIITMLGAVGYVWAIMRAGAGEETTLLTALFSQGLLGWGSAVLMLGGVATWLAGNFSFMKEVVELPEREAEKERL